MGTTAMPLTQRSLAVLALIFSLTFTSSVSSQDNSFNFNKYNPSEDDGYFDFILLGLGTAGSILAKQLTEDNKYRVLAFEAGGEPPAAVKYPGRFHELIHSSSDWNDTSSCSELTARQHQDEVFELTSGRVLGGGSSIAYMFYARGNVYDYSLWAKAAKSQSWSYEHILPYYKQFERLEDQAVLNSCFSGNYGKNGSVGLTRQPNDITSVYLKAFKEMNKKVKLDINGNNTLGFAQPMFTISNGTRQSTAFTYLARAANRSNLVVSLETLVTKLLLNDNNRVYGVQAKLKNGTIITATAKREVIVCAGTLRSPQLLMLSGIGPKKLLQILGIPLKADLPVGKNFQEHVGVIFGHKLNITTSKSPRFDPHKFPSATIMGNVALDPKQNYPDYRARNYIIPSDSKILLKQCSVLSTFNNKICQSLYNQTKNHETMFTKLGQLHPISRGDITLRSTDPEDRPIINPCFFCEEKDLEDTVNYMVDFLKINNTNTFKQYEGEFVYPDLPECDKLGRGTRSYLRCYIRNIIAPMNDYSSTCAMGSVVDDRLKVFGIQGLRIADASVIPYLPSGGVQASVMALAYKAADMIMEDN